MLLDAMATILAATAISLVPGARAASCPNGTVSVNLTSSGDMQPLTDAMNCTGPGVYGVTLHGHLQIREKIQVSDHKNVTVTGYAGTATGSGSDTISALGSTSDAYAVIDAGNRTGMFLVSEGSTLTISNLILEGGCSGDGAAIAVTSSSTLKVFDCNFTNNTASMFGGAISANGNSNIYIHGHTYFDDNWAYSGGAISAAHSNIYINGSTMFRRNFAEFGGAIFANNSDIHINGNTECYINFPHACDAEDAYRSEANTNRTTMFVHNSARRGGAIYAVGGSIICCAGAGGTVFLENEALDDGGAISLTEPTKVHITSVLFFWNTAYHGGAIYTIPTEFGIQAVYQKCSFSNNYATDGGATYLDGDAAFNLVNASYFWDNHAGTSGGAVYVTGSLKLMGSSFDDNTAGRDGVAISSSCASSLVEFEYVTFDDNGMLCPLGQYEPIKYVPDAAQDADAFAKVCGGCSADERTIPAGILGTPGRLPSCEELPTGTVAVHDGTTTRTLSLAEGYYRDSVTSDTILECYRHEACVGGTGVEGFCADGYEGSYCSVCSKGYASGIAHSCRKCSGFENLSAVGITMAVCIAVFLAAVVALRRLGNVVEHEKMKLLDAPQDFVKRKCHHILNLIMKALPFTAIKIVVVVWQIIFQFAAVAADVYPKEYEFFLSHLNFVNLDLSFITSYSCLLSTNFHGHLLLATILPSLSLATLALAYHVAKQKYPISSPQRLTVWSRHLSAGLGVIFFVYSSIASTILQTFSCQYIDGDWYLRADYSISCESRTHVGFMIYAVGMSIVYPLGIPALFCWWLVRNRKHLKASDRQTIAHLEPYSGIWSTYKPSRYYYEVLEYFRRLTISVTSVFLIPNSVNNIALVFTLTAVFMFVSESLSPFESNLDMGLYRWGNGVVMASMFVALLNTADASDDESLSVFGWVLIIVNVVMIVAVVVEAVALVRKFRGQLKTDAK